MTRELPAWAVEDNQTVYCSVCGEEAVELPVGHTSDCIYRLDIVA